MWEWQLPCLSLPNTYKFFVRGQRSNVQPLWCQGWVLIADTFLRCFITCMSRYFTNCVSANLRWGEVYDLLNKKVKLRILEDAKQHVQVSLISAVWAGIVLMVRDIWHVSIFVSWWEYNWCNYRFLSWSSLIVHFVALLCPVFSPWWMTGGCGLGGTYDHIKGYCDTLFPTSKLDQYWRLIGLTYLGRTLHIDLQYNNMV